MKIAVIYSGQLRGQYKDNIERLRQIIPSADFYFTTWHNQPEEPFIDKVFHEPVSHYNPSLGAMRKQFKILRKVRNGEIDVNKLPVRLRDKGDAAAIELIRRETESAAKSRIKARNHTKQHLIYALSVDELIDQKKYDILIRARYDVVLSKRLKPQILDFCEQVYENHIPMGFRSYNSSETLEGAIKPPLQLATYIAIASLHDFLIIHRADMFDPKRTLYLYEKKMLPPAESGWYETLCKPYNVPALDVLGFAKIGEQHAGHLDTFQKFYHEDPTHMRYNFKETLVEACDDILIEFG